MPIIRRIRDLLSANLHDAVEQWEDPEKLMRHAVREMEATLDSATSAAARSIAAERLLEREIENRRQQAQRAYDRAAGAMQSGNEPLARRALAAHCWAQRQADALAPDLDRAQANNAQLRQRIDAMQSKLSEARQAYAAAAARSQVAEARKQFSRAASPVASSFEVAGRFERLRARLAAAEAEADAWVELTSPSTGMDDLSLDEQDDASKIESLLDSLRRADQTVDA